MVTSSIYSSRPRTAAASLGGDIYDPVRLCSNIVKCLGSLCSEAADIPATPPSTNTGGRPVDALIHNPQSVIGIQRLYGIRRSERDEAVSALRPARQGSNPFRIPEQTCPKSGG